MTGAAAIARELSEDARALLKALTPVQAVRRPGIANRPFHISPANLDSWAGRARFPEEMILDLIAKGVLYVTQATGALPGRPEGVAFSARLSKLGEEVRTVLRDAK